MNSDWYVALDNGVVHQIFGDLKGVTASKNNLVAAFGLECNCAIGDEHIAALSHYTMLCVVKNTSSLVVQDVVDSVVADLLEEFGDVNEG
jgi:hypothetical protein